MKQLLIIALLFSLAPFTYFISGIAGMILILVYHKKQQELAKKYAAADTLENTQRKTSDIEAAHQQKIRRLQDEIEQLTKETVVVASEVFVDPNILSEEYKNQLSIIRLKQNELIKANQAIARVPGTEGKVKKIDNNNVKQLLRCFNSECEIIIYAVTTKNIDSMRTKIQRSYEQLNKIFETDGIYLTHEVLKLKQEELVLSHSFQIKREQEREEQKAIREQMLEEERVRKEIEREKAKIEKEETQFKSEIDKLMKYIQKASDIEKQLYVDKIHELEEKLKLLEKDKENVFQREQNTRAGFVYVISNIGAFGEDVFKIGMTRRLEPLDRVKELGDASVPFEFDVHAMIFSEDAPALETTLHQTFKEYQVNKVNPRKEFFRVPLSEVEQVVKSNHNATVTFTQVALATEYRESLKLALSTVTA